METANNEHYQEFQILHLKQVNNQVSKQKPISGRPKPTVFNTLHTMLSLQWASIAPTKK